MSESKSYLFPAAYLRNYRRFSATAPIQKWRLNGKIKLRASIKLYTWLTGKCFENAINEWLQNLVPNCKRLCKPTDKEQKWQPHKMAHLVLPDLQAELTQKRDAYR